MRRRTMAVCLLMLCFAARLCVAERNESAWFDLRHREMDSETAENVAQMDGAKARTEVKTFGDAMAVLYNRLNRDVYPQLIDGAWSEEGYKRIKVESGEYGYPGGRRYVDPNTFNQMVAWLLSDDMEIGVIMGFPKDDPQTSVCCVRSENGITTFDVAEMLGLHRHGVPVLPTGDFTDFQEYVELYKPRDAVRTLYYLPDGIGISVKDLGSHVVSETRDTVLLWSAEAKENPEFDWLK